MKSLGWVLLVAGLLGIVGSWMYAWGTMMLVVMVVVAIAGAWMVFFKGQGGAQM